MTVEPEFVCNDLSKHFQESKIKKIVPGTENNESLSLLKLVTDRGVVLHRTISHQTQHCGE